MPIPARGSHHVWRRVVTATRRTASGAAMLGGLSLLALLGCSPSSSIDEAMGDTGDAGIDDAVAASVRVRFEPGTDATVPFGAVPFPSDLYRDDEGAIALGPLPGAASPLNTQLARSMADLDGFGALGPVYFHLDGVVDAASLPADGPASLDAQAAVFVVDIDTNSPQAFERVPVEVHYHQPGAQLVVTPVRGRRFVPGRRYAAIVTSSLLDTEGQAVGPAPDFVAARGKTAPEGPPRLVKAHATFAPVLTQLQQQGVDRQRVVSMAVFRVQTVAPLLADARAEIRGEAPAFTITGVEDDLDALLGTPDSDVAGLGLPGGVLHAGIGGMLRGRLSSKDFLVDDDGVRHGFGRDEVGKLLVRSVDDVPFTVWLPPTAAQLTTVPVVIYVHDLGADRSDSVVVANRLSAAGYAVVAMDLPFHGSRVAGADEFNRFTGAPEADGFGDGRGDFVGRFIEGNQLQALHPAFYRGAMRQALVDLMQLVHVVENGDLIPRLEGTPYTGVDFDHERVGVLGVGVGGGLALAVASMEPTIGAVEAVFPGGHVSDSWSRSPARRSLFEDLSTALAIGEVDGDLDATLRPQMALYQALLDGGDPFVLAGALRRLPVNALVVMAKDDEIVPNAATEAVAYAIGAEFANARPAHVPDLQTLQSQGAVSGNFLVGDDVVTRMLVMADPATHDAMVHRVGERRYAPAEDGGFTELDTAQRVQNPLDDLLEQAVAFFDTWRSCAAGNAGSSCPASVMPLQ